MDELRKNKIVALPIEDLNMVREISFIYSPDFAHLDLLRDIMHDYNETQNARARSGS
jgi:hypothetical protein